MKKKHVFGGLALLGAAAAAAALVVAKITEKEPEDPILLDLDGDGVTDVILEDLDGDGKFDTVTAEAIGAQEHAASESTEEPAEVADGAEVEAPAETAGEIE